MFEAADHLAGVRRELTLDNRDISTQPKVLGVPKVASITFLVRG